MMFRFGSLRARIIVMTSLPLLGILLTTLALTGRSANTTVRRSVHHSLTEAGSVFVQLLTSQKNELLTAAQVTVRDPRFFATFSIPAEERGDEFVPTLDGVVTEFLRVTGADFIELFAADGTFLTGAMRGGHALPENSDSFGNEGISLAMKGVATSDFYAAGDHIVVAAVSPVYVANSMEAVVRLGRFLGEEFVAEHKRLTGADVALVRGGREFATTYPIARIDWAGAAGPHGGTTARESITLSDAFSVAQSGVEFLTMRIRVDGVSGTDGFDAYVGRELQSALAPVLQLERRTAAGAILAVLVTLGVGFIVAHSITRPLSNIVAASTALQNGQYDYPIVVNGSDEVAELGRNFTATRQSLQEHVTHLKNIDQAKSNFIALASHELRTPLTVITGFNEMIASGALGEVPESVRETTGVITEQLSNLNHLVQSMLDLTYMEQGLQSLNLTAVELDDLVRAALAKRKEVVGSRKLKFEARLFAEGTRIRADMTRMTDAILALVDNAIRFTPDGGSVTVSTKRAGDRAFIHIEDTGVGIPPNELRWIFEKIYEVGDIMHHSSGRHGFGSRGFGLGLALCRAIVESHNGEVQVESVPGRGSRFTIALHVLTEEPSNGSSAAGRPEPEGVLI